MSRVDEWLSVKEEDVGGYVSIRMTLRISVEALLDKGAIERDPGMAYVRRRALRDTIENHAKELAEGGFSDGSPSDRPVDG